MFIIGIFCFIFGLFAWLVYGSKKLIEGIEEDYALMKQVKTYDISDKQYWVCFDTIIGCIFIAQGLWLVGMFFTHLPRNNSAEIMLVVCLIVLMLFGLGVLFIYPNYHYRILTKDRPVTFDPLNKMMKIAGVQEDIVFCVEDIEFIVIHTTNSKFNLRYLEMKLKNGETHLFDPRFWAGWATEKFFSGVPQKVIYQFIPWFRYPIE